MGWGGVGEASHRRRSRLAQNWAAPTRFWVVTAPGNPASGYLWAISMIGFVERGNRQEKNFLDVASLIGGSRSWGVDRLGAGLAGNVGPRSLRKQGAACFVETDCEPREYFTGTGQLRRKSRENRLVTGPVPRYCREWLRKLAADSSAEIMLETAATGRRALLAGRELPLVPGRQNVFRETLRPASGLNDSRRHLGGGANPVAGLEIRLTGRCTGFLEKGNEE